MKKQSSRGIEGCRAALGAALLVFSLATALQPPAATAATNDPAAFRLKVGDALDFNLLDAPEVPRGLENISYFLVGARKDSRVVNNIARLSFTNTTGRLQWKPEEGDVGRYDFLFAAVQTDTRTALALRRTVEVLTPEITTDRSALGTQLAAWWQAGTAAGLTGVAYDNHDGGHSRFNTAIFPQLSRIDYPAEYIAANRHVGAQVDLLFPFPTVGNSSMAAGSESGGCLQRTLLLDTRTVDILAAQYRRNLCYLYPEHMDHDPGRNGRDGGYGDLLPANTPFGVLSQGSSGSDQPFIGAWLWTIASFRPDVRRMLIDHGLLSPTMQAIFRQSNKNVTTLEDYFSGRAHPTAFEGSNVDTAAMMKRAQAMTLENVPPLVMLRAQEDVASLNVGLDCFDPGADEALFTTPYAIARVFRGTAPTRRLVVSAAESFALNGRVDTFRWVVLRGNPARVKIVPLDKRGTSAEIQVAYQTRQPVVPGSALESARVDIGVFAANGQNWSAPAFISFLMLDNEARTYEANGRLVDIGYETGDAGFGASDIVDWGALADTVLATDDSADAPGALLRSSLKAEELTALRAVAAEVKGAAAAVAAARATQSAAVSDEEKKSAKSALDDALAKQDAARSRTLSTGGTFAARVVAAFTAFKDDPAFVSQHAALLAALPGGAGSLAAERRRLIAMGVARPAGDGLTWTPVRGAVEKLTTCERNLVEWYNIAALRALYPKIISRKFRVNYVDSRLTLAKPWRDVYHYDAAGTLTGWTRYRLDRQEQFTAAGDLIAEQGADGKAVKIRKVAYGRKQSGENAMSLEMLLGPEEDGPR